jgi:hypothetical protein
MQDDIEWLRREHPGWSINAVWTSAVSGPDYRKLLAWRGPVIIAARTAVELAAKIRQEEGRA